MHTLLIRFSTLICVLLLTAIPALAGLEYGTFIGGPNQESGTHIDLDSEGNVVILGHTSGSGFPTTAGAFDETFGYMQNLVIAKLTPDLSTLISATYLGGDYCDMNPDTHARAMVVGLDDTVTIAGRTECDGFPVTADADVSEHQGGSDGFLSQLSPDLGTLLYSTFITVEGYPFEEDCCTALTLLSTGWFLVAGYTFDDWYWIIKYSPDLRTMGGSVSGYWVGETNTLAVDTFNDDFFAIGSTTDFAFETTPGAYDTSHNGGSDLFVLAFDSGMTLQAATFLGGAGNEGVTSAAVCPGPSGDLLLAGSTSSDPFPVTPGAFDSTFGGSYDGFVARFSPDLAVLRAATYLGGSAYDYVKSIDLTPRGTLALIGVTDPSDFPVTPGAFDESSSTRDGYVAEMTMGLDRVRYATYIGGDDDTDELGGMVIDMAGRVVAVGVSRSGDFPATPGAYDTGHNGNNDLVALVFDLPRIQAELSCSPGAGTLPFTTQFGVVLANLHENKRRIAGRIDVLLAGGEFFPSLRAGFTNVSGQAEFGTAWNQNIPSISPLVGENVFTLAAEDITPAPYNQPPYKPSGDAVTDSCTIIGRSP